MCLVSGSSELSISGNDADSDDVHGLCLDARLNVDWSDDSSHGTWCRPRSPHYSTSVFTLSFDFLIVQSDDVRTPTRSLLTHTHTDPADRKGDRDRQLASGLRFVLLSLVASAWPLVCSHTHTESVISTHHMAVFSRI